MQIVVDSFMVNYQRIGKGPIIVFVHGWGDNHKTFLQLAQQLSRTHELVLLDLPGFDGQRLPKTWDLADYSEFIASCLKKIDAKTITALIGHSNGGAICISGLASGTLKANKLVLLASSGVRDVNSSKKSTYKVLAKVGKVLSRPLPQRRRQKLRQALYDRIGSDYLLIPELAETFKQITSHDVRSESKKVEVPTLLLYGSDDTATPPEFGEILQQQIPNSELEIVDGADHFLHHSHASYIARRVAAFLGEKQRVS